MMSGYLPSPRLPRTDLRPDTSLDAFCPGPGPIFPHGGGDDVERPQDRPVSLRAISDREGADLGAGTGWQPLLSESRQYLRPGYRQERCTPLPDGPALAEVLGPPGPRDSRPPLRHRFQT